MAGKKDKNCSEVDPNELLDWANETLMKLKLDKNALKNNKSNKAKRKSDSSSQFKSSDATTYISEKVTHLKKTKKIKHITVERNPLNEGSRINTQKNNGGHKSKKSKHGSKKVLHEESHDSTYEKQRDSGSVNGNYINCPHHCMYNKKEIKRHQEMNVNDVKLTVDKLMAADSKERKRAKSDSKERRRISTNEGNCPVNTGHTDLGLESCSLIDDSNECERVPKKRKKCHETSFSSGIHDKREIKVKKDRKHKYVSSDLAVNDDGIEVMSQKKKYKSINKYEKRESYLILQENVHNSSKQHKKKTKPKYDRQEDNLEDNVRDEKRPSCLILQKDVHNCDTQHKKKKKSKHDVQEARVEDSARDKNKELNLILQEDVRNGDEQHKKKKKPKYNRQEDRVEDTARDEYKESYLIPQEDVHNGDEQRKKKKKPKYDRHEDRVESTARDEYKESYSISKEDVHNGDEQHRKKKKPKYDRQDDRVEDTARDENKESHLIRQEDVCNSDKQLKKKKKPKYDRQNNGVEDDDNQTLGKLSIDDIHNSNMLFEGHEKKKGKKYKHCYSYSTHLENEENHKNVDMHKTEFISEEDKQLVDKDEEKNLKQKKQKRKRKDRDYIPDESVCDKECSEITNHDNEVIPKKKRIVTDIECDNSDKRHKKRHKSETELSSLKTNENQEDRIRSKLEEESSTNSARMLKAKKKKKEKHKGNEMSMAENETLLCTTEISSMKLNEDQEGRNIRSKIEEESSTNSLKNLKAYKKKKKKEKHNDNEMSMTENETLPCTSEHKNKKYKNKSEIDNRESASEKNNISYYEESLTITTVMPQKKNHKHANVENNLVNDDETIHERTSENLTDSHSQQMKLRPVSKTNFGLSPIARILFAETECCHAGHNCQKYRKTAYVYTSESEDSDSDIISIVIKSEPEEIVIKEEVEEQNLQMLGEVTIKQEITEDEYIASHTQNSQHLFEVSRAQQSAEHVNKVDTMNPSVDGIIHKMTECMNMEEKKNRSSLQNNFLSVRTAAEINSRLEMLNNPADSNDILIRMYGTPIGNNTFNNVRNLNENEGVIHAENNCYSNAVNNDHVLCSDSRFVRDNTIRVLNNTDASTHTESSVNERNCKIYVSNPENSSVKSSINENNYKFSDNKPENPSLKSFDENNYRFSDNNPENPSIKSSVNENDYKFSDNTPENCSIKSSVNEHNKFSDGNRPENEFHINSNGEVDTNIHYNEWSNRNTETDVTFYNVYDHKFTIEEVVPQFQERNNCEDDYRNCTRSTFDANLSVMNNNAMKGVCTENTEKMHESPLLKFESRHGITNVQSEENSMFSNNGYNNMQVYSGSAPSFNIENGIIHQRPSAQHTNTKQNCSKIIASNPCEYLFEDKTIRKARGIVTFIHVPKRINKDEVASRLCIPKKQIQISREGKYARVRVRFFHLQQLQIIKENATKLRSSQRCVTIQMLQSTSQHPKKMKFQL